LFSPEREGLESALCKVPEGEFDFLGYTFGRMYSPRTGQARLGGNRHARPTATAPHPDSTHCYHFRTTKDGPQSTLSGHLPRPAAGRKRAVTQARSQVFADKRGPVPLAGLLRALCLPPSHLRPTQVSLRKPGRNGVIGVSYPVLPFFYKRKKGRGGASAGDLSTWNILLRQRANRDYNARKRWESGHPFKTSALPGM
jgi:hypothetical protein